jgi:hypothetical protein
MAFVRQGVTHRESGGGNPMRGGLRSKVMPFITFLALFAELPLGLCGCGETAKPVTPTSANDVHSYFGSPFPAYANSASIIDHSATRISVSTAPFGTPVPQVSGTFTTAPTGFLSIVENFAAGVPDFSMMFPNPGQPLKGAWAVEIPGAGALANLLNLNLTQSSVVPIPAGPAAMVQNTVCPSFPQPAPFLYVTVPALNANSTTSIADFGGVAMSTRGSAVTFAAQSFLIGSSAPTSSTVTGGCSDSFFGPLTTYPLNSFGAAATSVDTVAIGGSGLLIDSFVANGTNGAFGQNSAVSGVIGVAVPSSPVDVSAVNGAKYNGFIYAPQNNNTSAVPLTYDIHVLAAAFGDRTATSTSCSSLRTSLAANHGQGAGTVAALPSANSLYGGEFLTTTGAGVANDPTGANGSENCDVAIDLGQQDSMSNGLFPNATVFIGSNYPPFSANNPWVCPATCAVSFPAAAVVGQVQGQFVIFVVASSQSNPPAQLPGSPSQPVGVPQPVGIYLFQRSQ